LIDTHSHLLPGVDHGCPDLATSILMAREAAGSGVSTVICTPHLPVMDRTVSERARVVMAEVRAALATAGIDLTLLLGFEVDLEIAATNKPARLGDLTVESTAGAKSGGAIVLEMPYRGWPIYLEETIFRLAAAGLRPVLAHPERNDRVQKQPELLGRCLKAGAVAQATAASITGEFDRATERAFFQLVSTGLIGLLASDAHAFRREGWTLLPLLERLRGSASPRELQLLVQENPRRLLAGEPLLRVQPPGPAGPRRGRRGRAG
jgi:protein-tyrosine phosphatase